MQSFVWHLPADDIMVKTPFMESLLLKKKKTAHVKGAAEYAGKTETYI